MLFQFRGPGAVNINPVRVNVKFVVGCLCLLAVACLRNGKITHATTCFSLCGFHVYLVVVQVSITAYLLATYVFVVT